MLTLLAVPNFKSNLADAYCDTYRAVTAEYTRGVGTLDRSGYTLSVQFLNRVTYVQDLVQERDLFGTLGRSLLETLAVAAVPIGPGAADDDGNGNRSQRSCNHHALFGDILSPWSRPREEAADLERARKGARRHHTLCSGLGGAGGHGSMGGGGTGRFLPCPFGSRNSLGVGTNCRRQGAIR